MNDTAKPEGRIIWIKSNGEQKEEAAAEWPNFPDMKQFVTRDGELPGDVEVIPVIHEGKQGWIIANEIGSFLDLDNNVAATKMYLDSHERSLRDQGYEGPFYVPNIMGDAVIIIGIEPDA